jgi:lipid II:glycine glycyltransferase (peptidoglycan interpeptide bridge formation enzyme)
MARDRRWKYFEIRGDELLGTSAEAADVFYGHSLKVSANSDELLARFGNGTRGAIKQALKNNLEVEVSQSADAVRDFYDLQIKTRKKHGVPPQPFGFFEKVHQQLIESGCGFTVLVRAEGHTAAAAIFLHNGKHAIYKYAASDSEFGKTRANNLVLWEGIQRLGRDGCELLDFGRTSPDHDGLRHFKRSWGAEEHMIRYCRFDVKQARWMNGNQRNGDGIHQRVFRNLPVALNRLAGAILYPHLD